MIFEQVATGGCQSYLVGCERHLRGRADRPRVVPDRPLPGAGHAATGCDIHYVIDTHTHADHFSATRRLAKQLGVPVVMHRLSPATRHCDMRVDDGEMIVVGQVAPAGAVHAGAHGAIRCAWWPEDRVFTGDTLLIGGTGPHRPAHRRPRAALRQPVRQAAEAGSGAAGLSGARLQGPQPFDASATRSPTIRACRRRTGPTFVELMNNLNLSMPTHLTESLRTNLSRRQDGGATAGRGRGQRRLHGAGRTALARSRARSRAWWCWTCVRTPSMPATCLAPSTCRAASWNYASIRTARPDGAHHHCVSSASRRWPRRPCASSAYSARWRWMAA